MMIHTESKLPKNHFKCFNCRLVISNRDGDWFKWGTMEVHLCGACNKKTAARPERSLQIADDSKALIAG